MCLRYCAWIVVIVIYDCTVTPTPRFSPFMHYRRRYPRHVKPRIIMVAIAGSGTSGFNSEDCSAWRTVIACAALQLAPRIPRSATSTMLSPLKSPSLNTTSVMLKLAPRIPRSATSTTPSPLASPGPGPEPKPTVGARETTRIPAES